MSYIGLKPCWIPAQALLYSISLRDFISKGATPVKKHFPIIPLLLAASTLGVGTAWSGTEDGLVAHYRFSEGSGPTLYDYTPNQFDGAINNATWVTGPVYGSALSFNGSSGNVNPTSAASLATIGDLGQGSISVWFYYRGIPAGNSISPIFYLGQKGYNNFLVIEVGHNAVGNEKLYFTVASGGALRLCFDSATNLQKDRWYHFVAVVGPNGNTGYLNGAEMTARNYNSGTPSTVKFFADVPIKEVLGLGRGTTLPAKSNSQFYTFYGAVGETRIYDRPLTTAEVQALYGMQ
jgi:hypothetical protein